MMPEQILNATAETILEEPVKVEVEILNLSWWEKVAIRCGLKRTKKTFFVRPATPGTMIRISKLLLRIPADVYKGGDSFIGANYKIYAEYGETVAEVIAIALKNARQVPTKKEIQFLLDNLTAKELMTLVSIVLKQLDVMNFMSSIISIRGVSLLNPEEPIASGE